MEISSETDLLAMENPRQKRLRTFRGSGKKRARRRRKITRDEGKKREEGGQRKDGEVVSTQHTDHLGNQEEQRKDERNGFMATQVPYSWVRHMCQDFII